LLTKNRRLDPKLTRHGKSLSRNKLMIMKIGKLGNNGKFLM